MVAPLDGVADVDPDFKIFSRKRDWCRRALYAKRDGIGLSDGLRNSYLHARYSSCLGYRLVGSKTY